MSSFELCIVYRFARIPNPGQQKFLILTYFIQLSPKTSNCSAGNKFPTMNNKNKQQVKKTVKCQPQKARPPRVKKQRPKNNNVAVSRDENSSAYQLAILAKQASDPHSIEGVPAPFPTKGGALTVSRRYNRVVEFAPPSSNFSVVMSPDLETPGFITGTSIKQLPVAAPGPLSARVHGPADLTARGAGAVIAVGEYDITLTGLFKSAGSSLMLKTHDLVDDVGTTMRGFNLVGAAGSRNLTLQNEAETTVTIRIYYRSTATGLWTYYSGATLSHNQDYPWPFGLDITGLAFTSSLPENRIRVTIGSSADQVTSAAIDHYAPSFVPQAKDLGVTEGRVVSMAMKITNTSEKLKRGGVACSGRVPYIFNAFGNISTELSKLPANRRYHGTADKGIRSFWIPATLDEWEFDGLAKKLLTYEESNYLIAHFSGLEAGTSFMMSFDWLVEFTLDNQNFPKTLSPAWTDEFDQVIHLLSNADAATCNPVSIGAFKAVLDSIRPYVESGQAHYYRHKAFYDYLMRAATALI